MSFSKSDLDKIKSKILVSTEIEKKTQLIKKGKDYWCRCLFHEEKTPSCKINDDQGSFYCFGCGAKGDIFSLYTDLYNYSFIEAVKELGQRAGIEIKFKEANQSKQENSVNQILEMSSKWFQDNLQNSEAKVCNNYLKIRKLSLDTIKHFKLGYSYNSKKNLYQHLKDNFFLEEDIIKSNVVRFDKNNNIRDYFYKRLIFPIRNERSIIVGFGGRTLDESNPKYINSPESNFFHKRSILYNLSEAKKTARKKNNLLICEGYMDVISLHQNGIQSVVAPLGTALTEEQLVLSWNFSSKPTIMFDGDKAGLRASFKTSLMSLPLLNSKRFLQFIILDEDYDPDSYINKFSIDNFVNILRKPIPLVNFIFEQSSKTLKLKSADEKIIFDKYLDEIITSIKDDKIKYFYKNELKSLFFEKIRNLKNIKITEKRKLKSIQFSLEKKQILSFIAGCLNHVSVRKKIILLLLSSDLLDDKSVSFLNHISSSSLINEEVNKIINSLDDKNFINIIKKSQEISVYQLFPYSSPSYNDEDCYKEIAESCQNLNTRLLNLKKINKSLDNFVNETNNLNWNELQKINIELSEKN
jgi:DNA primase